MMTSVVHEVWTDESKTHAQGARANPGGVGLPSGSEIAHGTQRSRGRYAVVTAGSSRAESGTARNGRPADAGDDEEVLAAYRGQSKGLPQRWKALPAERGAARSNLRGERPASPMAWASVRHRPPPGPNHDVSAPMESTVPRCMAERGTNRKQCAAAISRCHTGRRRRSSRATCRGQ